MQIAILMHIQLREAAHSSVMPPTTLDISSGRITVQASPTEQGPLVLSLVAGGQMRPTSGTVLLDGAPRRHDLQHRTAIIDAPRLSAPDEYVSLRRTINEELTYVGRIATRARVRRFLETYHLEQYAATPMTELPPIVRITALTEIALRRPEIEAVIITNPDRHGGSAAEYYRYFQGVAARGYAVLLVTGTSAARNLQREFPENADRIHLAPLEEAVPTRTLERIGVTRDTGSTETSAESEAEA